MPTISESIRDGRKAVAANEVRLMQALMEQYGFAWRRVEQRLRDAEQLIQSAILRGEPVSDQWLRRQVWWDSTLRSIEDEMSRFTNDMARQLAQGQTGGVTIGQRTGNEISDYITNAAANRGISISAAFPGRINPIAFERWVIAQAKGSPVRDAIDRYGTRVSESVRQRMTEGFAEGLHPRQIVRNVLKDVGPEAIEGRMQNLIRSETHRAYRGALADQIEPMVKSGAVVGWKWISTLSARSCSACLSMHGRVFAEFQTSFHPSCRCTCAPIPNPAIIPARPPGISGEEWLRGQPESVQRRVLKSDSRYDAFQNGSTLADFTTIKHDKIWGDTLRIKPMREVRAA